MTHGTERLLAGRYRLVSVVGRGGMGTVWRARDEMLHRDVAVKEVLLAGAGSETEQAERHERTLREARASARLNHPGVVTVHDVVDEDDRPWIVMELVHSRSLHDVITEDGPLPPHRAAEIGRQVVRALRAAHAIGVLHRDVKPANVLIAEEDGRAVLTDFGIAQITGDATLTAAGGLLGSPAYMSPERLKGERAGPAADLWALGATLYTAVEGRSPYERSDAMAVIAAVMVDRPAEPRNAGPLAPVLAGLLAKDPAQRMNGAAAEDALAAIATMPHPPARQTTDTAVAPPFTLPQYSPGPPTGSTIGAPTEQRPPSRSAGRRIALIGGAVALAAAAVLTAGFVMLNGDDGGTRGNSASGGGGNGGAGKGGTSLSTPPTPTASPSASETDEGRVRLNWAVVRGHRIKVPEGWRRRDEGNATFWVDPVTKSYVQFDTTPWSGDPRAHAEEWERLVVNKKELPGFARRDLRDVYVKNERRAADLEYTWTNGSRTMHAVNRGMVTDTGPIAVAVVVPDARWDDYRKTVNNVLGSLRL